MLHKLIRDRHLTLPQFDQAPSGVNQNFPNDFSPVPNRNYNIQQSTNIGSFFHRKRSSQIVAGAHGNKAHRTFRWLPWIIGKVSCVPLAGADILTGRMSGCWLVIFRFQGVDYAGHIGTDTAPDTPASLQAKAAWRNAVNTQQIQPIAAFNPVGPNLPATNMLNIRGEAPEFYGAFEQSGQVYTVVLTAPGYGGTARRIARVVQMQTTQDVTDF
ncbi:hypothetical protein ACONUD_13265 [Microbulbifer harenosus]|uniref:Uncharacterized protein n=1 Tax=Microbulbifer harenosus TaxID=2576840 RepID=A0ABY2UMC9_9GAMM|nr:hypothetical protein [Microbulbifer harenosus]TLM79368.1 hypothetical protein FDY93_04540 [Microbulbifer harenosus]